MGFVGAVIVGAVISAGTSIALQQLNRPDKQQALPTPEPPADIGNEGEIAAKRLAEQRRMQQRQGGRASTIFAGKQPLGLTGQAPSAKKVLTGE